jgi:mannose-6-phosphate isomerase-like protein (cupin superfamily)
MDELAERLERERGAGRSALEPPDFPGARPSGYDARPMPKKVSKPTTITAAGTPPKRIDEYVGRVNTGDRALSIAHMRSPAGWSEPGQRPEFSEYTVVLKGTLRVTHEQGSLDIREGEAVITEAGEWVQYSSPDPGGAEYIAVCLPAFSPETVHRS